MQTTVYMSYSTGYREDEDDEKYVETSEQNNTITVGKLSRQTGFTGTGTKGKKQRITKTDLAVITKWSRMV